jgi:PAS domain S-box-containing protein
MLNPDNQILITPQNLKFVENNNNIKVLVFDSETILPELENVTERLDNFAFSFHFTSSITEFNTSIKLLKPNLILSELHHDEVQGKEVLDHCKMLFPDIPFIFLTTHTCNKSILNFLEQGATDFLLKENIEDLPAVIYKALRQSHEKYQIREVKRQRWEDAQRFKGLIEHSQDPVITYTDSGEVTYVSPAIEKVLGYTVNEFLGTNVIKHIHPDDLKNRHKKFKILEKSDVPFTTIEKERLLHKNGHYIWVKAIISDARLIPGIQGYMTNFSDITEKVKSNIKLEKSLKDLTDYKIALDESSIVGITDLKGKITYANSELISISKYPLDELLGSDYRLFDSNEHPVYFYLKIWNTISAGNIWKGEIRKKAKDGSYYWVHATIVPFLDNQGKPYQYIVVMRDITLRKLRTFELRNTIDLLTSQNKRLLNFSYIVSHNLRSHTSNMQNLIDYIENTDDEDEKNEMMHHLKNVTTALNDTLYNLNEVVSIQSNSEMKIETIALKPFVSQLLETIDNQIKSSGTTIEIEIENHIQIDFNISYLESIFLNLILNAIRYKHPERDPKIKITAIFDGYYTQIEISDNGLGIDLEKYKEKLFGMYKTFHNNKESKGLGLFMSKNQIEALGGKIEVESKIDFGTTFKILIK